VETIKSISMSVGGEKEHVCEGDAQTLDRERLSSYRRKRERADRGYGSRGDYEKKSGWMDGMGSEWVINRAPRPRQGDIGSCERL